MKIVLDTNVLLTSISERSAIHSIFAWFIEDKYILCVTNEILFEYEEIISKHLGTKTANFVLETLINAPNLERITVDFYWNYIQADPDDNKFVDCAFACNAQFIVSEDKHFRVLKNIPFPKITVLTAQEFITTLQN